jgi:hypothetical protein
MWGDGVVLVEPVAGWVAVEEEILFRRVGVVAGMEVMGYFDAPITMTKLDLDLVFYNKITYFSFKRLERQDFFVHVYFYIYF